MRAVYLDTSFLLAILFDGPAASALRPTLGLSARAHTRILRVARTIADLAAEDEITAEHLAEASLDRRPRG